MAAVVTLCKSPEELATFTGFLVYSNLDDSEVEAEYEVGDLVTTQGGNYTIVKYGALQTDYVILQKGGFYTVIEDVV
jgi:hypothetical protein